MTAEPVDPSFDAGAKVREGSDPTFEEFIAEVGANPIFVADFLSAAKAHERCGCDLYRSVAERTLNPALRARYQAFGDETEQHVEILENLIEALGGNPDYISSSATATEYAGKKLVESTYVLAGSLDVMTAELVMLDAVVLAETLDHANWTALAHLAESLPDGDARDRITAAVTEVLHDEDEHLGWAQQTRLRLVTLQAEHELTAKAMGRGEELVDAVRRWFDR
jgi:ferritin-like metal-binding protein YciE